MLTLRRYLTFVVLCIAIGACGPAHPAHLPDDGQGSALDEASEAEREPVVVIIPEEPITLNPYLALPAIVKQVADATMAGLTTIDENGDFIPVLAAELPTLANGGVSADFRTITWRLRPGLYWSDGTPLTSDDVRFTWEAVSDPGSGAVLSVGFELIESIETPDALTAVVHYSEMNLAYLSQFRHGLLPRHATGEPSAMLDWAWNRKPVSAGPFVVREWIEGERIVMDRNPRYYLPGQPFLDRLVFEVVPDADRQVAMMAAGEAHAQLWPVDVKSVYDARVDGQAELKEIPGEWNMALSFNLSRPFDDDPGPLPPHPALGDLRVRQAIAHAIDYDAIVEEVNPGVFEASGPFVYGWYRCDLDREYTYNPAWARVLLEEAGWIEGPDGVRVAEGAPFAEDGTRLSLEMQGYTNFQPLVDLENALVAQLAEVGIEVTIRNDDFSVIFGSFGDGAPRKTVNFDLLIYDSNLGIEPHTTVVNTFHSSSIPSVENPAGGNYMRWVNAAADAAIERAGSTVDLAERRAAYCDLAQEIAKDVPRIHLYLFAEGHGLSNRLGGYRISPWNSLTWDVQNWRLAPLAPEDD
jgi:peptide/nickel transport system substrate-binding protein